MEQIWEVLLKQGFAVTVMGLSILGLYRDRLALQKKCHDDHTAKEEEIKRLNEIIRLEQKETIKLLTRLEVILVEIPRKSGLTEANISNEIKELKTELMVKLENLNNK